VRSPAAVFAVSATATVPLPLPLAPPVIAIQPRSELAAHAHPAAVVTLTEPGPPDAEKERELVESVNVQDGVGVGLVGEPPSQATMAAIRSTGHQARSDDECHIDLCRRRR
jgi:hypothetical protein